MIDLHCHLLPSIDDGAVDLDASFAMARQAIEDGVAVVACTPHILPGMYENDAPGIRAGIVALQKELDRNDLPLKLVIGADVHLTPDLVERLQDGRIPTLNDSRYFLFEPPHHVAPPRLEDAVFNLLTVGYVPIVTHPERLTWIESHYAVFKRLVSAGAWMQLTAGAIYGKFGPRPQYWSEKMMEEGLVHIVASDAHDPVRRRPGLSRARDAVAKRLGVEEAMNMVAVRPAGILDNVPPDELPAPVMPPAVQASSGWFNKIGDSLKRAVQ